MTVAVANTASGGPTALGIDRVKYVSGCRGCRASLRGRGLRGRVHTYLLGDTSRGESE